MFQTFRFLTLLFFASLMVGSLSVSAQEPKGLDDLPRAVKKSVKDNYPEAKIRGVAQEKNEEGETIYEVEMTVKGRAIDIIVATNGEIETIEEEIDSADLPRAVQASASKAHPKAKITKAEKVTDEDKKVTFEVFLKLGDKEPFEVLMSRDGTILKDASRPAPKAEKKSEKDEDDEKEAKTEKTSKKPKN